MYLLLPPHTIQSNSIKFNPRLLWLFTSAPAPAPAPTPAPAPALASPSWPGRTSPGARRLRDCSPGPRARLRRRLCGQCCCCCCCCYCPTTVTMATTTMAVAGPVRGAARSAAATACLGVLPMRRGACWCCYLLFCCLLYVGCMLAERKAGRKADEKKKKRKVLPVPTYIYIICMYTKKMCCYFRTFCLRSLWVE